MTSTAIQRKLPRGTYARIARELGVSRQLVSMVAAGKVVSAQVSEAIERAHQSTAATEAA